MLSRRRRCCTGFDWDRELAGLRRNALETALAERAQLGRDLHDGLAPLLAGAGLTAEALRRDLAPGAAGEQEAAKLSERLRHAASQVREIAHGLDPGELEQTLGVAVSNYLETLTGPAVPMFSARVEADRLRTVAAQTAYLVVLEAGE